MAFSQGGQSRQAIFTEINITPLTDIFLVLLIMMMVLAPMFDNNRQDIKVPSIKSGKAMDDQKVVVEVSKEGKIYAAGKEVSAENLASTLSGLKSSKSATAIVLRADKSTKSSEVLKVFDASSQAGFEKLTIAGEPLNQQREQELNDSQQGSKRP